MQVCPQHMSYAAAVARPRQCVKHGPSAETEADELQASDSSETCKRGHAEQHQRGVRTGKRGQQKAQLTMALAQIDSRLEERQRHGDELLKQIATST